MIMMMNLLKLLGRLTVMNKDACRSLRDVRSMMFGVDSMRSEQ